MAFFIMLMFCKNAKDSWYLGTVIVAVFFCVLAYTSESKVTNKSDTAIKAKPEDACKPLIDVAPGVEHYGFDGVKSQGEVFKARNGTHITVRKDGGITTKSIAGKMANSFLTRAGYISKAPDSCWEPLFKA